MTKSFENVKIKRSEAAHRQIAGEIRERIQRGEIKPGVRLPSTEELAGLWGASYFTVHTALKTLVKDGLLERLHGSGTYVRERRADFSCAGIYLGNQVIDMSTFVRRVHGELEKKLTAGGIAVQTFAESRPKSEHGKLLPALQRAVAAREIQCVISPANYPPAVAALNRLPLPLALVTAAKVPRRVQYAQVDFFKPAFTRLRSRGCRTVGWITHLRHPRDPHSGWKDADFWSGFEREMAVTGLTTRDEWLMVHRKRNLASLTSRLGYEKFMELWRQPKKPDVLVVYPDVLVPGVITAMLQLGVRPPKDIQCMFHRNKHFDILCPFPAMWLVSDEERMADALIEMVRKQFKGEKVSEVHLPYTFAETRGI